ncbi:24022_t:CDS:1, partial [Cetraspora pellucida]
KLLEKFKAMVFLVSAALVTFSSNYFINLFESYHSELKTKISVQYSLIGKFLSDML